MMSHIDAWATLAGMAGLTPPPHDWVGNDGQPIPGHLLDLRFHGPDWLTGGTVGPEGSVITLILWALMAILFVKVYRERRAPVLVITEAKQS